MSNTASPKASAAKIGALGFMAVALGCAALAAYLIGDMMTANYSGTKVVPVVVAKSDLKAGTTIDASRLEVQEWPEGSVPTGAYHSIEELMHAHEGSTPTVGILSGEPVVAARMSSSKSGTGIASLIRPHMRAIALKVGDEVGFTGLVYPGAYVDVIATIRDPMGRGPSSRIAVQNARVLSVGMDADVATRKRRQTQQDRLTGSPQNGATFVTLEVTPEEAEILSIARNEGVLDLALRNGSDDELVETAGATPTKFSAFAVDPTSATADQSVAAEMPQKPRQIARKKLRRGLRRGLRRDKKKRIQIVANDEPDVPRSGVRHAAKKKSSPTRIETYNAN